jgi:Ca2+-binding RTX toxin-like protein
VIEGTGNNQATVTISAFRDDDRTDLIETQSYQINTANGVLVEGGRRNDHIEVLNLSVPVTLRGGSGIDELIGSDGNDTLEGDHGSDTLKGGAGSDTYLFRGPRYQALHSDKIDDVSGTDDVLDFSALNFAINVDLASTANQAIDYAPPSWTTFQMVRGQFGFEPRLVTHTLESRLNLDLKTGTGSTGIENVRGTRFDDRIYGNELDNELFGNDGIDWLYGYDGIDSMSGGAGADILRGGDKRDYLYGEAGLDQLFGENGDDYLDGGFDGYADIVNGGQGADEFVQRYAWVWTTTPTGYRFKTLQLLEAEVLDDFSAALGDKINRQTVVFI